MKYSYQWLKDLSKTEKSPREVADLLTRHAFEVEGVEECFSGLSDVVVGEILEVRKHPNADTLSLARVAVDVEKTDVRSIVCGAKNINAGDRVPVALPGAKLPNGMQIRETIIRGEPSAGMLCAADELGLGMDHSGIVQLSKDAPIGVSFAKAFGKDDAVIELSILSNRGHDALSHIGIAREICAIEGRKGVFSVPKNFASVSDSSNFHISLEQGLCRRYIGAVLDGIVVEDSPKWMQNRLQSCGIRPINTVVDVTNYVMLELGQPMHAFDAERIQNADASISLSARSAYEGEAMTLLDGSQKSLSENDIVIANEKEILALAGIMGGESSGISASTKSIVLEAACFHPARIRETRMRLRIETESSYRFERELDPNIAEVAMRRAIELLIDIAGATPRMISDVYPDPLNAWTIAFLPSEVEKLLGVSVTINQCVSILENLGCVVLQKGNAIEVSVPTYRIDLQNTQDVIEEIGRISGYDRIAPAVLMSAVESRPKDAHLALEDELRNAFANAGAEELMTYAFCGDDTLQLFGGDSKNNFSLQDPMSPEWVYMRTDIVPSLLQKTEENLRYCESFCLFEVGKTYRRIGDGEPKEERKVAAVFSGGAKEVFGGEFFALKGTLDRVFSDIGIGEWSVSVSENIPNFMHPARFGNIMVANSSLGYIGEAHPLILQKMGIKKRISVLEVSLEKLIAFCSHRKRFVPMPKYPFVERDISLSVPKRVLAKDISESICAEAGSALKRIELFDVFETEAERSLAFHLWFGSDERTLGSAEVDVLFANIVKTAEAISGVKAKVV